MKDESKNSRERVAVGCPMMAKLRVGRSGGSPTDRLEGVVRPESAVAPPLDFFQYLDVGRVLQATGSLRCDQVVDGGGGDLHTL